jgi:hypothetical protein
MDIETYLSTISPFAAPGSGNTPSAMLAVFDALFSAHLTASSVQYSAELKSK